MKVEIFISRFQLVIQNHKKKLIFVMHLHMRK